MIKIAEKDQEIEDCYHVMSLLRPHLDKASFVKRVRSMEKDGYRLAFLSNDNKVSSVVGFRIYSNLFKGKYLYVDDLVTSEDDRSLGHGEQLLSKVKEIAIAENCTHLSLDASVQNSKAHKFYANAGLSIIGFHFAVDLV